MHVSHEGAEMHRAGSQYARSPQLTSSGLIIVRHTSEPASSVLVLKQTPSFVTRTGFIADGFAIGSPTTTKLLPMSIVAASSCRETSVKDS